MTAHLLTFRVYGDSNDVRDFGNALREAIQSAQRHGQHEGVGVEGPTIELLPDPVDE